MSERTEPNACFDQLVVGCTFAGLGRVFAQPANSLLVESSAMAGGEWIEAFDPGTGWDVPSSHPLTESIRQELIRRGVVAGSGIHLPGLGPVLAEKLLASGARFLFLTDVVQVRAATGGYDVELAGPDGRRTVRAGRVVDTTTRAVTRRPGLTPLREKRVHAALNYRGEPASLGSLPVGPDFCVLPGLFRREGWLSLEVPEDLEWAQARERLCAFWAGRPDSLREWDLVAIAERFAERPEPVENPPGNWLLLPSRSFPNPLAAFRAGALAVPGEAG